MAFERIAYSGHAYQRMKQRRINHADVHRIVNEPDATHPGNEPDRIVARGYTADGRRVGVVYTLEHERDADLLVVTVIDFGPADEE